MRSFDIHFSNKRHLRFTDLQYASKFIESKGLQISGWTLSEGSKVVPSIIVYNTYCSAQLIDDPKLPGEYNIIPDEIKKMDPNDSYASESTKPDQLEGKEISIDTLGSCTSTSEDCYIDINSFDINSITSSLPKFECECKDKVIAMIFKAEDASRVRHLIEQYNKNKRKSWIRGHEKRGQKVNPPKKKDIEILSELKSL